MNLSKRVILLCCGSFNPVTNMHLRMFELARDYLNEKSITAVKGLLSPVHDAYGKIGLISSLHRCNMVERAVATSDWIKLDRWECDQIGWTRTVSVLKHHQTMAKDNYKGIETPSLMLLMGADVLESFAVPNLWKDEDVFRSSLVAFLNVEDAYFKLLQCTHFVDVVQIEEILKDYGIVVITRVGSNPQKFIAKSGILTKYEANIHIVYDWTVNEISATSIRDALSQRRSVKYLLQDSVIEYIQQNSLYGSK